MAVLSGLLKAYGSCWFGKSWSMEGFKCALPQWIGGSLPSCLMVDLVMYWYYIVGATNWFGDLPGSVMNMYMSQCLWLSLLPAYGRLCLRLCIVVMPWH